MTYATTESNIDNSILLEFYLKNIRPILSDLEYGNVSDREVPILIGTLEILLNSPITEWQNEGRKILDNYPNLIKYIDSPK